MNFTSSPNSPDSHATFWRSLQTLCVTRVVIALVLLLYVSFSDRSFWIASSIGYGTICIAYLILALVFGLFSAYRRRQFMLQLLVQISVDLSVISKLYILAGGAKSGLAILYLLPLAGSAILAPLIVALFFSAAVALFLLLESAYQIFVVFEPNVPIWQAGLYGAAFFTMVVVVNRLALRLINQEALARERGRDLAMQQAINHLVIADVGDGILVLGPDTMVFTANPAAQNMLGLSGRDAVPGLKLQEMHSLLPVADAFFSWLHRFGQENSNPDQAYFITIKLRDDGPLPMAAGQPAVWSGRRESTMHLKLRFVEVEAVALSLRRYVVFLQDVSEIENQAQQLKLASMGRLTASIAHEVRNPLAAIGHASALLSEDLTGKTQMRLLKIIADNVDRVNRMIEDILQLSRKVPAKIEPVDLQGFLAEILAEFQETHALAEGVLVVNGSTPLSVHFDPLHLREVVVNLLTNAVRYASGQPRSICLTPVGDGSNRCELHVQDDGPGMTMEVRSHLFEPFYTTSSKGTGLGLYLAREMCLNNKATLDYEYRIDATGGSGRAQGRFVISFALPEQANQ